MPLESHIHSLKKRHQELEVTLEEMLASPSVNDDDLNSIKRKKLQLKDRIEQLTAEHGLN